MKTFRVKDSFILIILLNVCFYQIDAQSQGLFSLLSPLLGNFNGVARNAPSRRFVSAVPHNANFGNTIPFQGFINLGLKLTETNPSETGGIQRLSDFKRSRVSGPKFSAPSIFPFTNNNNQRSQQFNARNNFKSAVPTSRAAAGINNLGYGVLQMIGEISQYSDIYQQKDQDYGSVNKLLQAFFDSMGRQDSVPYNRNQEAIFDGTEIGRNRPIAPNLFESDIVLTVDQLKGIVLTEKERRMGKNRQKRKVITGSVYRWKPHRPIPYDFQANDDEWKNTIRSAIAYWEDETCLRWNENGAGSDRIIFIRGSGCYSSVGRVGGRQQVSIGYGCEDRGIITHEIGHSLGFWHEQSRPDRDTYIELREKYIARGTEGNFVRRSSSESDDLALPYDFGSVMHYGPTAFSIDWDHKTILTRNRKYERTIGQRDGPSFIDVKQINRMYCHDRCGGSRISCLHGGYPNPNNCAVCKCPSGLGGLSCETAQQSECGGELQATDQWQQLAYKGSQKCYWIIRINASRTCPNYGPTHFHHFLSLMDSFSSFFCDKTEESIDELCYLASRVPRQSSHNPKESVRTTLRTTAVDKIRNEVRCEITCRSFLEVKYNSDFQRTGFRLCCEGEVVEVVSEQSEVILIFNAVQLEREGSFSLQFVKDSGKPLPRKPAPIWKPGRENRPFRNLKLGTGGPIERFILNAIPRIRDPRQPLASIASIITDFTVGHLLGVHQR